MIRIVIYFFFTLISLNIISQGNTDSISKVWKNEKNSKEIRLKALIDFVKNNEFSISPDSMLLVLAIGEKLAKENNKEFLIDLGLSKALAFNKLGNYIKGIEVYKEILILVTEPDLESKVIIYSNLAIAYGNIGDYDLSIAYNNKVIAIDKDNNYEINLCHNYNSIAVIKARQGNYSEAKENYLLSLSIAKKNKDKEAIAMVTNNLASIFVAEGDYVRAIDNYTKGLSYYIENKDDIGKANVYNNIGTIYLKQDKCEEALKYFKDAVLIAEKSKQISDLAIYYNNLGQLYEELKDYIKAVDLYNKSLKICKKGGDRYGVANSYTSLGSVYLSLGNYNDSIRNGNEFFEMFKSKDGIEGSLGFYNKAIDLFSNSLKINLGLKNKPGEIRSYLGLASVYLGQNRLKKAKHYGELSFELAQEINDYGAIEQTSELLYKIYKKGGNKGQALELFEIYIKTRDSIANKASQEEIIKQKYKLNYEKKAVIDSLKFVEEASVQMIEIEKQKIEIKAKKNQQYGLYLSLALITIFLLYVITKNNQIKKQKVELEKQRQLAIEQSELARNQKEIALSQKEELKFQHTQIRDSIGYAQTLQKAVLPSFADVNDNFKNNFVYLQPKDVVSGDFFWTYSKKGINYLAVVDCTGHGVPGALMTIVANNLLNEIVLEDFSTPKEIIEELHQRIKVRVGGHKDAKVRDSMDLGLLSYDTSSKKVNFSGTHTSLYLVRNSKLQKIKGSKANIGYRKKIKINEHVIDVVKNDMLYFHSDGYPDQKGGEKNKKFYNQPIRTKFEEISLLNLEEQKSIMEKMFNDWKGTKEQLDDVCLIGIRI